MKKFTSLNENLKVVKHDYHNAHSVLIDLIVKDNKFLKHELYEIFKEMSDKACPHVLDNVFQDIAELSSYVEIGDEKFLKDYGIRFRLNSDIKNIVLLDYLKKFTDEISSYFKIIDGIRQVDGYYTIVIDIYEYKKSNIYKNRAQVKKFNL